VAALHLACVPQPDPPQSLPVPSFPILVSVSTTRDQSAYS
jgi:hypothetical protein